MAQICHALKIEVVRGKKLVMKIDYDYVYDPLSYLYFFLNAGQQLNFLSNDLPAGGCWPADSG